MLFECSVSVFSVIILISGVGHLRGYAKKKLKFFSYSENNMTSPPDKREKLMQPHAMSLHSE